MTISVRARARTGVQRPRLEWVPAGNGGWGAAAADLAEMAGLELDSWQRYVLDMGLRVREDGRWAAFEVCLIAARQLPGTGRARSWRRWSWRRCSWICRTAG